MHNDHTISSPQGSNPIAIMAQLHTTCMSFMKSDESHIKVHQNDLCAHMAAVTSVFVKSEVSSCAFALIEGTCSGVYTSPQHRKLLQRKSLILTNK